MARNHFHKVFQSPYFQSEYYKSETPGGKLETKIENFLKRLIYPIKKNTPRKPSKGQ